MSVLAVLAAAVATACAPAPAPALGATQLVVVDAPARTSTAGTLALWEQSGGCWSRTAGPWSARLGRNGVSASRREGDGTTPLGSFPLGSTVYGTGSDPGVLGAFHRLVCGDWWDSDVHSATYNRFRHVACGTTPPFAVPSEKLWRQTTAYRVFATIDFNTRPVVRGRGSAIFLHADTGEATNGCVSLPLARLTTIVRALRPDAHPRIMFRSSGGIRT